MEKTLAKERLPQIDSIEGMAKFWDTHDLTDFEDDLEEMRHKVFVQRKGAVLTVSLRASEIRLLNRAASSKGVKDTTLLRRWIVEKLRNVSALDQPHNKPLQTGKRRASVAAKRKRNSRTARG
jgi:hypothetical protein